jgi:hypothetical protein
MAVEQEVREINGRDRSQLEMTAKAVFQIGFGGRGKALPMASRGLSNIARSYITLVLLKIKLLLNMLVEANRSWVPPKTSGGSPRGSGHFAAMIPVSETPKPITTSVPMFETSLMARDHCDPRLLATFEEPIPAEIGGDRLVALAYQANDPI